MTKAKAAALVAVLLLVLVLLVSALIKIDEEANAKKDFVGDYIEMMSSYDMLIHRIWIDNPSYVEDVLWETDEFLTVDSLKEGDWEDVFYFWDESDSVQYEHNKQFEMAHAIDYLIPKHCSGVSE